MPVSVDQLIVYAAKARRLADGLCDEDARILRQYAEEIEMAANLAFLGKLALGDSLNDFLLRYFNGEVRYTGQPPSGRMPLREFAALVQDRLH